ncbi:uncharacterized protein TNCV_4253001 [Trichonephila clavipes]|nr:uncharacterized protein TNCV_4253001 [Trichonephila clavipes]
MHLKNHLAGQRHSNDDEAKTTVKQWLSNQAASFDDGIQKLVPRYAGINGWISYKQTTGENISRQDFLLKLAVELGTDFREACEQPKQRKNMKRSLPKSTTDAYQHYLPPECGSLVIKVTDSWSACQKFEPNTTKDPPCRGEMHVKSVQSSNVLSLMWCG